VNATVVRKRSLSGHTTVDELPPANTVVLDRFHSSVRRPINRASQFAAIRSAI